MEAPIRDSISLFNVIQLSAHQGIPVHQNLMGRLIAEADLNYCLAINRVTNSLCLLVSDIAAA